jgi:thiamine biosynthesis lipoprotein
MNRPKQILAYAAVMVVCAAGAFSILRKEPALGQYDGGHRLVMGTFARVVAIAESGREAARCAEAAYNEIKRIDGLMSDFKSDSEIGEVNRDAFRRPVQVGEETFEVVQRSIEFSRLSAGAFDITVGPLVDLWKAAADANSEPNDAELDGAKARVGYEKLIVDSADRTIRFQVDGMRLDLGAIAKGYGVDKAIEVLKAKGAQGGMVEIGGEVRCFGQAPKGKTAWTVGLQDPANTSVLPGDAAALLMVLQLDDAAVATSGDYQQFVIVEGKRHSHIIDTKKAIGAEGLSSVTIIADNCTDADALATAVSVMGAEKGLRLIEGFEGAEAILVGPGPKYEMTQTSGAQEYIREQ